MSRPCPSSSSRTSRLSCTRRAAGAGRDYPPPGADSELFPRRGAGELRRSQEAARPYVGTGAARAAHRRRAQHVRAEGLSNDLDRGDRATRQDHQAFGLRALWWQAGPLCGGRGPRGQGLARSDHRRPRRRAFEADARTGGPRLSRLHPGQPRGVPSAGSRLSCTGTAGTLASVIDDVASQVEYILVEVFSKREFDDKLAPLYSRALVGMTVQVGGWWMDVGKPPIEVRPSGERRVEGAQ
jgi:hypothetical protein